MLEIIKKNYKYKLIILLFFLVTCFVRRPNFDNAIWNASDTNYQCLMNVRAMQQTDRLTGKILPIITFTDGTDYGLEYSSGAFDKVSNKFFYYVSFPAFPFFMLKMFFDITSLPVGNAALFIFDNILYGVALWLTISMFQYLFVDKLSDKLIIFASGITFCCSTEIMHSLGLTYWGQNWYMLFFPLLVIALMEYLKQDDRKKKVALLVLSFIIMQTEWTGYLACATVLLVIALKKGKEARKICITLVLEMILSMLLFLLPNIYVVGMKPLVKTLRFRAEGRMRNIEYSLLDRGKALFQSFNSLILICLFLLVWHILRKKNVKDIMDGIKENKLPLIIFTIPILENFILSNHAITYSMDRMKIYYLLCLMLFILIEKMEKTNASRRLVIVITSFFTLFNLLAYRFIDNNYLWSDDRLKDSKILAEYIEKEYNDCAIGQLGTDSVWGYSKLLFGKGIEKCATTDSVELRAEELNKKYAISINGVNLANTQYWYTSAVISDSEKKEYKIIGVIPKQYEFSFDDFKFLKYYEKITIYKNGFDDKIAIFDSDKFANEDEIYDYLQNIYNEENINGQLYYIAEAKKIPKLIKLADITQNEWNCGVDYNGKRLIIEKTASNVKMLEKAQNFTIGETEIPITDIETDEHYMFITVDEATILDMNKLKYPNNIEVNF